MFRYLKEVDKFGELHISAFVTAGGARFMLLHEQHNDSAIRTFFQEVDSHTFAEALLTIF